MTTSEDFKKKPWAKETQHQCYRGGIFSMSPAPEYANSEVLLASLYRLIGLESTTEGNVPKNGRELINRVHKDRERRNRAPNGSTIEADAWASVLQGVLESPKLPNQSAKRFIQVTPLVPGLAIFSGSARLSHNSWPAGSLIRRMIWMGCQDHLTAHQLWRDLFDALTVTNEDDVFARWLEQEVRSWCPEPKWDFVPFDGGKDVHLSTLDFDAISFLPARAFVKDLRAILSVKNSVTRRQWTSLLEGILRIASVSHVIWLCDIQARIWSTLQQALDKKAPLTAGDVRSQLYPTAPRYFSYGSKALNGIKDKVSRYLEARLGINSLLWNLEECGIQLAGGLASSEEVFQLCQCIQKNSSKLIKAGAFERFIDMRESESRVIGCQKGIGVNMMEFSRHVLGQRQTAEGLLRGYDQSYLMRKKGNSSSSPWIVSFGPVAVLGFVHCSLFGMVGPRSILRLGQRLAAYGLAVESRDLVGNDLGHQLRMLGLVLDSPDAESGMLLLPPFEIANSTERAA